MDERLTVKTIEASGTQLTTRINTVRTAAKQGVEIPPFSQAWNLNRPLNYGAYSSTNLWRYNNSNALKLNQANMFPPVKLFWEGL
jgi:hypothetical protein